VVTHASTGHAIDIQQMKVIVKVKNFNRDGGLKISHTWDHILNTKTNEMAAPSSPSRPGQPPSSDNTVITI
jgi:hypothetical protein